MKPFLFAAILFLTIGQFLCAVEGSGPLNVCATVPDLGSLVSEIGGDQVSVTTFGKGMEDAHFIEAKPSFVKSLSKADLYVQIGLELEIGYGPLLLQGARNKAVFVERRRALPWGVSGISAPGRR